MSHTLGPWKVVYDGPSLPIIVPEGPGGTIALVRGDNAEPDARLIAAAPTLLAALEQLVQRCAEPPVTTGLEMTGNGGMIELLTREARAAIASVEVK